jgi:hypothetical protein
MKPPRNFITASCACGANKINHASPREAYKSLFGVLRTFFFQKKVLSGFKGRALGGLLLKQ